MRPPPVCWKYLKRSFWRSDFLLKYHRDLNPQETELREREREKEKEKEKENLTFWEEKYASTTKILFNVIPFSPLHHTISKTLSKSIDKIFLTVFGPSFSLATYMTWVVPFLLTHELHIFGL
jgi:hypothetical protein